MVPDVNLIPLNRNELLLIGGNSRAGRYRAGDFYQRDVARLEADAESFIIDTVSGYNSYFGITIPLDYWSYNRAANNATTFS